MQPAVSGLSEEFPGKVVGQNVEAGLPDSIADIEALGFNNHGLVIRSDDGTMVWKQADHEVNMEEVREALAGLITD